MQHVSRCENAAGLESGIAHAACELDGQMPIATRDASDALEGLAATCLRQGSYSENHHMAMESIFNFAGAVSGGTTVTGETVEK